MQENTLWYEVSEEPLQLSAIEDFLYDEKAGGVNVFVGVTRKWTGKHETVELSYECYKSMAEKEMLHLLEEAQQKWPVIKGCILHRVGTVKSGKPSVIIGVATPHRNEAFQACRFLIDRLKVQVPIWKKERYADGTIEWVNPAGVE